MTLEFEEYTLIHDSNNVYQVMKIRGTVKFSYGWPQNQTNPAFRDRLITLDNKKPCIMIGRNGSGKTLASKILQCSRNLFLGTENSFYENLKKIKQIGLDWIEVELNIPFVQITDDGYGVQLNEKIAWDIVEDGSEDIWLSSLGYGQYTELWDSESHSFRTSLILKVRVCNLQSEPSMQFWYHLESKGTLSVINNDDDPESFFIEEFDEPEWHRSFSSVIRSEIQHVESIYLMNKRDKEKERDTYNLWVRLIVSFMASPDGNIDSIRRIYQDQFRYIRDDLNQQCMTNGIGNPEVADDDMDSFDPGDKESNMNNIIIHSFEKLFPEINISDVNRVAPKLEKWKKDLLEELILLRKQIAESLEIEKFGLGLSMLLEILGDLEELRPRIPIRDMRKSVELSTLKSEYLDGFLKEHEETQDQLFDEYKHVEPWLKLIPLYIQQRVPKSADLEKIGTKSMEFSLEVVEIKEHLGFVKEILVTIDECFPNFEQFKKSENKYEVLIESITKFQNSGRVGEMYHHGIKKGLSGKIRSRNIRNPRIKARYLESTDKEYLLLQEELSRLVPRYMILFWFAFEMDPVIIGLFETYVKMFDSRQTPSLDNISTNQSWSEFLHIIENTESLPSGFKHLLSLVMGVTNSDKRCIYFIDEPEISLHIDWQRKLVEHLRFLLDESREASMLLIATHSPDIIQSHLDDVIDFSVNLNN
jgi:hypothetical protein